MSWWTDFKKGVKHTIHEAPHVGHYFQKALDHYDEVLRSHDAPSMYYGTDTGLEIGPAADATMNGKLNNTMPDGNRQIYDDEYQAAMTQTPTYSVPTYNTPAGNGTPAYKANAAATANSIKQGGMTKDDLIQFNTKHPNETVNRG